MTDDDGQATEGRTLVPVVRRRGLVLPSVVEGPLDVALGAAVTVARPVLGTAAVVGRAVTPLARVAWALAARPPLVPEEWAPATLAARLADRGRRVRYAVGEDATAAGGQLLDALVPVVLEQVLDRLDLTGVVLDRVDLERVVVAALDSLDLTEVVLDRVDLHVVVDSALDSLDLTALVRDRVDVAGLAEQVIDEVDLPEIIRESTTGVAGDAVAGARLTAVAGDEMVSRWIDRVLLRRQARRTAAPGEAGPGGPDGPASEPGDE